MFEGSQPPKLQSILSQERVKLWTSNLAGTFTGSIRPYLWFGLAVLTVGCAEYSLPEGVFELDAAAQRDESGQMILRVACVSDNGTSWLVTCHEGRWAADWEAPVNCAHVRHTALHDLTSSVRVTGSSSSNQGSCHNADAWLD